MLDGNGLFRVRTLGSSFEGCFAVGWRTLVIPRHVLQYTALQLDRC